MAAREFVRLANVDHGPGIRSNRLFQLTEINNVGI
jgi:hypothetical protein